MKNADVSSAAVDAAIFFEFGLIFVCLFFRTCLIVDGCDGVSVLIDATVHQFATCSVWLSIDVKPRELVRLSTQ